MKILAYYTGNLCVCKSTPTVGVASNGAFHYKKLVSKPVIVAAVDNDSDFLIPVYLYTNCGVEDGTPLKNKDKVARLRKCLSENFNDPNFVVLKKSCVEQVGDYFVEIDEKITSQTATPEQLEQIQKFEALLRPFEKSRSL